MALSYLSVNDSSSISDCELTIKGGILELLSLIPKGKAIMADRVFNVQDLLLKKGLLLNIPPAHI